MNKFKKVLLGALSVLTLGLFVVTGVKVMAADAVNGTYTVTANDFYDGVTSSKVDPDNVSVKKNSNEAVTFEWTGTKTNHCRAYGNKAGGTDKVTNNTDVESWTYEINTGGSNRTIKITTGTIADTQEVNCIVYCYVGDTSNTVTINGNTHSLSEINTVEAISQTVTSGSDFTVVFKSSTFILLQITVQVNSISSTKYDVNYYDTKEMTNLIHNEKVQENKKTTSYSAYNVGKTFDKWLKVEDNSVFDFNTAITTNVNLYATWKDTNISNNDKNYMSLSFISQLYNEWGSEKTSDKTDISNTIYSLGGNVNLYASTTDVGQFGKSAAAIHTNGSTNNGNNSIYINAPHDGILTVYVKSGSGDVIDCGIYDSSNHTAIEGKNDTAPTNITELTYDLTKGIYEFGGTGALYIYYMSFEVDNLYVPTGYSTIFKEGSVNTMYTITPNTAFKTGSKSYNGITYTSALSLSENTDGFNFTAPITGTVVLVTDAVSGKKVKVNGTNLTTDSEGLISFSVVKDTEYSILKNNPLNIYYADYQYIDFFQEDGSKTVNNVKTIYKRYIAILPNFNIDDIESSSIEINVYSDSTCKTLVKSISGKTPNFYDSLKSSGELYVTSIDSSNYCFRKRNDTLFAMYSIGLANDTHKEYVGNYITATITINGVSATTTPVEIVWND